MKYINRREDRTLKYIEYEVSKLTQKNNPIERPQHLLPKSLFINFILPPHLISPPICWEMVEAISSGVNSCIRIPNEFLSLRI